MTKYGILFITALFWGNTVNAQDHPACANLDYVYQNDSSKQLRAIAASCRSPAIAQLFYNRAYHKDLVKEGETLSLMVSLFSPDVTRHFEAYRLYIALIEAFAPLWYADPQTRVAFLNREYDRRGEVAELRLHGYDRLADLKEKRISLP